MTQYKSLKSTFSNPIANTHQTFKPNQFRKNSQNTVIHNNLFIYNQPSNNPLPKSESQLLNTLSQSPLHYKKQKKTTGKHSQKSTDNYHHTNNRPILKNTSKIQVSFLKNYTNFSSYQTNPSSDNIQSSNSQPFSPYYIKSNNQNQRMKNNNQKISIKMCNELEKPFQTGLSPIKVRMGDMQNKRLQIPKQNQELNIKNQNTKIRKNSSSELQLFQILNPEKNKISLKQKMHTPHSTCCIHQLKESLIIPGITPKKSAWSTFNLQQKSFDESLNDLNKTVNTSIQMNLSHIHRKKSTFTPFRQFIAFESVDITHFQLGKIIGNGKFGEVFMARHKKTNFLVAIKKICKQKIKQFKMEKQIKQQIKLQYSVNHPNIVNLYGFCCDQQFIYVILQYLPEGTLFNQLQNKEKYNEKEVATILKCIVPAIKYLHDRQIAHRDIKPQNILISNEVLKLCDFGWAGRVLAPRKTYCGTLDYAPPEILQRKQYGLNVDLWCLGILIFELLTGTVPFQHKERIQSIKKIINVDKQKIVYPNELSNNSINLIESLLKKNPDQRLKINQVLNHPFFK